MARCDEGYRCVVCGADVEAMTDSALYLRYILGEVALEELHLRPECHLLCDKGIAQYIVDSEFPTVFCEGYFGKAALDPEFVVAEERRVTRAWHRLQQLPRLGLTVAEYPFSVTPDE